MASGTKLQLKFGTMSGEKTFSYNYGNDEADIDDIKALMNAMIENGSIFKYPPMTAISAKAVVTSETEWDLTN